MAQLNYISHPNPQCKGNPLIEVLGYPLTKDELFKAQDIAFEGELDLTGVPHEHHSYYLRSTFDNLSSAYVPKDEAYALYEKSRRMIEAGYKHRNPADKIYRQKMLTAIHQDGENQLDCVHLKRLTGETPDALLRANGCSLLAGLSGDGKTTMMLRTLGAIPQIYRHTSYTTPTGEVVQLDEIQISHLYVQVHKRKGQKAFLRSVINAVETVANTSFRNELSSRDTVDQMIRFVRKLMINYNVGLLVIDEAQNIDNDPDQLKIGPNEKTSMKFVEEIFNRIGVPLFFIGTLSMLKLFSREATIARRAAIDGGLVILGNHADSPFWKRLCQRLYQVNLLDGKHDSFELFTRHLHTLSQGIPAIAVSLMRATLSHMTKFESGKQAVTMKSLTYVFKEQFTILHKPLQALKNKKYSAYEDYEPIKELKRINEDMDQYIDNNVSSIEQQASSLSATDEEADKRVAAELAKVRTTKVVKKKNAVPEMDAELAKQIGVTTLLAIASPKQRNSSGV